MVVLLVFSWLLEIVLGVIKYLVIYVGFLLGGNLLVFYIYCYYGDYWVVGVLGVISGIIFVVIVLFFDICILFIFFLLDMFFWLFGVLFVLILVLGIKLQSDNIGYDVYFGGVIIGLFLIVFFQFSVLKISWWFVFLFLVFIILFLIFIVCNLVVLLVDNYWGEDIKNIW